MIVCGDFDYNLLNREKNKYVGEFGNIVYSDILQPYMAEPICMIADQVPSIVDNIFTASLKRTSKVTIWLIK